MLNKVPLERRNNIQAFQQACLDLYRNDFIMGRCSPEELIDKLKEKYDLIETEASGQFAKMWYIPHNEKSEDIYFLENTSSGNDPHGISRYNKVYFGYVPENDSFHTSPYVQLTEAELHYLRGTDSTEDITYAGCCYELAHSLIILKGRRIRSAIIRADRMSAIIEDRTVEIPEDLFKGFQEYMLSFPSIDDPGTEVGNEIMRFAYEGESGSGELIVTDDYRLMFDPYGMMCLEGQNVCDPEDFHKSVKDIIRYVEKTLQ